MQTTLQNVKEHVITRSFAGNDLFNIHAVNNKGKILGTYAVDLDLETAAQIVETLNKEIQNAS